MRSLQAFPSLFAWGLALLVFAAMEHLFAKKQIRYAFLVAPLLWVFHSVPDLIRAIEGYVAIHNENPKPFIWTATAKDILEKVVRANRHLSSKQNATLH